METWSSLAPRKSRRFSLSFFALVLLQTSSALWLCLPLTFVLSVLLLGNSDAALLPRGDVSGAGNSSVAELQRHRASRLAFVSRSFVWRSLRDELDRRGRLASQGRAESSDGCVGSQMKRDAQTEVNLTVDGSGFAEALATYRRSRYSKVQERKGSLASTPKSSVENSVRVLVESSKEEIASSAEEKALIAPLTFEPRSTDWICIGKVVKAHGVKGETMVRATTLRLKERFLSPKAVVYVARQGRFPRRPGLNSHRLGVMPSHWCPATTLQRQVVSHGRELRRTGSSFPYLLLKFEEINDRTTAAMLAGSQLYVHLDESRRLTPPSEILAADLIGFEVLVKGDPSQTRYSVDAADDYILIGTYKDVAVRQLLKKHFEATPPPSAPVLACGLHALGPSVSTLSKSEESPDVIFECEGCGLDFTDLAAAVCHERICVSARQAATSSEPPKKEAAGALSWMLKETSNARLAEVAAKNLQSQSEPASKEDSLLVTPSSDTSSSNSSPVPPSLQSLEGAKSLVGSRLARRFWRRVDFGARVSWQRENRFFPFQDESGEEAAERALLFTNSKRHSAPKDSPGGRSKSERDGYMRVDLTNPLHVQVLSRLLNWESAILPPPLKCDAPLQQHRIWLPYILGDTVHKVDVQQKTLTINAPPDIVL